MTEDDDSFDEFNCDSDNQVLLHNDFQKVLQDFEPEPKSCGDYCVLCNVFVC